MVLGWLAPISRKVPLETFAKPRPQGEAEKLDTTRRSSHKGIGAPLEDSGEMASATNRYMQGDPCHAAATGLKAQMYVN